MHRRSTAHTLLATLFAAVVTSAATAQAASKPRIAVQSVAATPAVMARAAGDGSGVKNLLEQVLQAVDTDLVHSINKSGRFEVVAASDLESVLSAQDVQNSGLYDTNDPHTARAFELAGFTYIAAVTVTNFQLIDRTAIIADAMGDSMYTFETIQLGATLKIYDVTRGTILDTASLTSEFEEETRLIDGAVQEGSFSNRMIGAAASQFASKATNAILDSLAPAKVIGLEGSTIFFNRGSTSGLHIGDLFELRDPGNTMVDPETGVAIGSTSRPIGWATVTSIFPKYSEAAAIELIRSPSIGHTILQSSQSLPQHIDVNTRAQGPFASPARPAATRVGSTTSVLPATPPTTPSPHHGVVAIFVANAAADIPSDRVTVFDAQLRGMLSAQGLRVVSRQDVLNAVSTLASEGPNVGTGDTVETRAQRLLSDRSSATAIASHLGASAILTATISSLVVNVTESPKLQRTVAEYTVSTSWTLLNGANGISVDGGIVDASERFLTSPGHDRIEFNAVDRLLKNDAVQIATSVRDASASGRLGPIATASSPLKIRIETVLANMQVPEIKRIDGAWTLTASTYPLHASNAMVSIDGMLVGSTPGPIPMAEGTHRLVIEHPLCETVDRYVQVSDLMGSLRIPMTLSASGEARWMQQSKFFESLKDGAVLRATELEKAAAVAEFLRNSSISIDTSNVQNLGIGQPSLWIDELK
jgi:hypothetical protein